MRADPVVGGGHGGHACLHGARAAGRQAREPAERYLQPWSDAVRAVDRAKAVRSDDHARHDLSDSGQADAARERGQRVGTGDRGCDRGEGDGQGAGRAVPVGSGDGRRSRASGSGVRRPLEPGRIQRVDDWSGGQHRDDYLTPAMDSGAGRRRHRGGGAGADGSPSARTIDRTSACRISVCGRPAIRQRHRRCDAISRRGGLLRGYCGRTRGPVVGERAVACSRSVEVHELRRCAQGGSRVRRDDDRQWQSASGWRCGALRCQRGGPGRQSRVREDVSWLD